MSSTSPPPQYHRPHQLWLCTPECSGELAPSPWGRCRNDPSCSPSLSLRGRRGVFIATCMFATLGLLLVTLGPGLPSSSWRHAVVEPGPLHHVHSQALANTDKADQCSACHDAATVDPLAWIKIASGNVASLSEGQATRCLKCHQPAMGGEWARHPHNVSPEALARTTQRITKDQQPLAELVRVKLVASNEQACSTCHKEHHGLHANLTQLTDQQCQACHAQAFESFAQGHPEFRHSVPSRRSRIAFDHVSHVQKHFPGKQQAFACRQCHDDDARRDVKQLASFERSCAQCHSQPIQAATHEGLIAFSFPVLNITQLTEAGKDIGEWPAAAQGDFDGSLPPLMRMLLLADDEAVAALEQLGPQFDFSQTTSTEQLESVARLAWSYKRLLNDLANDSAQSLRSRLEKVAGKAISVSQLESVVRQLPPALFREARRRWLPGVSQELAEQTRTEPAHLSAATTILPQIRSELLMENPLATKRAAVATAPVIVPGIVEMPPSEQVVVESKPDKVVEPKPGNIAIDSVPAELQPPVSEKPAAQDPNELASGGTWYLDDATLSVRYRSRGHADELLRILMDVAASATNQHVPHQGLLPDVLKDSSLGTCASCHSIDTSGEHYAINWRAEYRDSTRRHFTEFSHRPHLVQPQLANCSQCHRLNLAANVMANFATPEPMAHAHDFEPIQKANCVTCHTTNQAGGRCTLCHSYHAGMAK